jgi:CIC family chloride channel protein
MRLLLSACLAGNRPGVTLARCEAYTSAPRFIDEENRPLRVPSFISPEFFQRQLATAEALPQLSILAIAVGLFTGIVILAFRLSVDFILGAWILSGGSESFETLGYSARFALPVCGALVIGLALSRLPVADRRVGVVHVMERLSRHQGHLPARNALVQFFGGILALVTGQSGGREGPAIHLGAASASLMGQALNLPNNSMRVLVACGTASAIAGSFNTPIAGVIFAMEVVMMEYSIGSFIPVIIAAVVTTVMGQTLFGDDPAFVVAPLNMESLLEIPYIVLAGAAVGCVAASFNVTVQGFARLSNRPFWLRAVLAGVITGVAAIAAPDVMGVGYDTVNGAMLGHTAVTLLMLIVVLKVLTSAAAVGLGLPVGLIGPTFVIGAALGGVLGYLGDYLQPSAGISIGLYVMLGMSAMMAAVLQAPLAALMAVLELTANPNLILPAMLIIVVATLMNAVVFKQKSVFLATLDTLGLKYPPDPVTVHLQRAGVTSIMNRDLSRLSRQCAPDEARAALARQPRWIAVETSPGDIHCVLNAADLRVFLESLDAEHDEQERDGDAMIDLLEIPGGRLDVASLDYRATLAEAQEVLTERGAEALCIRRTTAPLIEPVIGIVTQQDIDNYRDRGD